MTETQKLSVHDILQRHFKNDAAIVAVLQEIEVVIDSKVGNNKDVLASKAEVGLLSKDIDALKIELTSQIESSSLRVESNLKSGINELTVWIIAIIFTLSTLFFVLSKFIH